MTEAEIRAILADYDIEHITRREYGHGMPCPNPRVRVYCLTRNLFTVAAKRTAGSRLELIGTGYNVRSDLHFLDFRILPEPAP